MVTSRRRSYTRRTRPSCILHGHHLAAHCVALCKGAAAEPRRGKETAYHQRAETTPGTFVTVIHQPGERRNSKTEAAFKLLFLQGRINADLKVALRESYISFHIYREIIMLICISNADASHNRIATA